MKILLKLPLFEIDIALFGPKLEVTVQILMNLIECNITILIYVLVPLSSLIITNVKKNLFF